MRHDFFGTITCPEGFGFASAGTSVVASSEYHRKQAELLAGLALSEPDQVKAAQLSLLALEHRNLADRLAASQSLQPPRSNQDSNRDRT
jgi:hypothetical protein